MLWGVIALLVTATCVAAPRSPMAHPTAVVLRVDGPISPASADYVVRGIEQAVTNRRVVRKFGIVSRDTTELRLASIETVDLRQSFWGRVFGYGNVEITGRGETAMVLDRIAHPIEVKREIESAYSSHIETPVGGATA